MGWQGGVGRKGRKLYLNNNKNKQINKNINENFSHYSDLKNEKKRNHMTNS